MKIEVFDWDSSSADDFLGVTSLALSDIISRSDQTESNDDQPVAIDRWIKLSDAKHGEIHLVSKWKPAKPASSVMQLDQNRSFKYVASIFIDR